MPDRAKAAVLLEPRHVEIRDFPIPDTGDAEGLLRVEAAGVCGSDIPSFIGSSSRNLEPRIFGHEIFGQIERIGPAAAERWGVQQGDHIIFERWIPCGHCEHCYSGMYRLCSRTVGAAGGTPLNYGGSPITLAPSLWGGFSEYVYLHPDTVVYKVSGNVTPVQMPLFTPIANGLSWVQRSGGATTGSTVVIQGPGQNGLGCVIGAKEAGAQRIIVLGLERDAFRLRIAREFGATDTVMVDKEDAVERLRQITSGQMADVVVDTSSGAKAPPIEFSARLAKRVGGTIVLVGGLRHDPASKGMNATELTIKTVFGRDRKYVHAALGLIESGKYPLDLMCTHSFPIEETETAFKTAALETDEDVLHVCIEPAG